MNEHVLKEFDMLNYPILTNKLRYSGIRGTSFKLHLSTIEHRLSTCILYGQRQN